MSRIYREPRTGNPPRLESLPPREAMARLGLRPHGYRRAMILAGRRHVFINGHPRVLVLVASGRGEA